MWWRKGVMGGNVWHRRGMCQVWEGGIGEILVTVRISVGK